MKKSNLMLSEIDLLILVGIAITGLIIGGSIYFGLSLAQQESNKLPAMSHGSQIKIELLFSPSGNATTGTITVTAQSTGKLSPIVLDSAIITDSQGSVKEVVDAASIDDNDVNTAADVPAIDTMWTTLVIKVENETLKAGASYRVRLVAENGNAVFVSQSFKVEA